MTRLFLFVLSVFWLMAPCRSWGQEFPIKFELKEGDTRTAMVVITATGAGNPKVNGRTVEADFTNIAERNLTLNVKINELSNDAGFENFLLSWIETPPEFQARTQKRKVKRGTAQLEFLVLGDSQANFSIGYNLIKTDGDEPKTPLNYLNLNLRIKGTSLPAQQPAPAVSGSATDNGNKNRPPETKKPTEKPTEPPKSQEEQDWEITKKADDCTAWEKFAAKYPQSKRFGEEAREKVVKTCPTLVSLNSTDNQHAITLENAASPVIDSIRPVGIEISRDSQLTASGDWIFTVVLSTISHATLFFSDKKKSENGSFWKKKIALENQLTARLDSLENTFQLLISGGTPPYTLVFQQSGGNIPLLFDLKTGDERLVFDKKEAFYDLLKSNGAEGGSRYELLVWDRDQISKQLGFVSIPKNRFPWNYLLAVGAGLLVALGLFALKQRQTQKRKKGLEALNLRRKEEDAQLTRKPIPSSDGAEPNPVSMDAEPAHGVSSMNIKGLRKSTTISEENRVSSIVDLTDYASFSMEKLWENSAVHTILLHRKAARTLNEFLKSQGTFMEEKDGTIPEIGGILMGVYEPDEQGHYRVRVEEFVPISPEFHNVYRLEFSTTSLVSELGNAQDSFPGYSVMGWFHTHPGHGLFLSKPDLTIQDGFFIQPWQFAMEIDNTTQKYDTGFFTRKTSGLINNNEDRKDPDFWFSWTGVMYSMS